MAPLPGSQDPASGLSVIGQYSVVRKIGDGGMGAVYEGRHASLGKRVALKVLLPEMASNSEVAARFVREGQAAARVRHPHVVDVYDVGTSSVGAYLVMELLEGGDLGHLLQTKGKLSVSEALSLLLPVFSAVHAAHREGVIHRDLKPANVFLARDSIGRVHPKVVDFGISKILEEPGGLALTQSAAVLGTPYYMAPEQVQAIKNTDARSDQYSLAVIVFECVTGQRPFVADSLYELLLAITGLDAPSASTVSPTIPRAMSEAIRRAMSRSPADRFASVRDFGRALLPFADDLTRALWATEFAEGAQPLAPPPSKTVRLPVDAATGAQAPTLPAAAASGLASPNAATGLEFSSPSRTTAGSSLRTRALWGVAVVVCVAVGAAGVFFWAGTRTAYQGPPESDSASIEQPAAAASPVLGAIPNDAVDAAVDPSPATPVGSIPPAVASSSASPPPVAGTSTGRVPVTAKTEAPPGPAPTPEQPGDGAIRGANSAWIVR